jgi:hypothetical protein
MLLITLAALCVGKNYVAMVRQLAAISHFLNIDNT